MHISFAVGYSGLLARNITMSTESGNKSYLAHSGAIHLWYASRKLLAFLYICDAAIVGSFIFSPWDGVVKP